MADESEKKVSDAAASPVSSSGEGRSTTEQAKIQTGRIPKPKPRGAGDTLMAESGDPMSSDTISLKRPDILAEKPVEKEEEEAVKQLKIFCWSCGQKLDLSEMEPFSKINCPSCNAEIIVPRWFDNYLLEENSGEGGMAFVYRGLDLALDREVAIKVLSPTLAQEDRRSDLFLHEARTAATLNHYSVLPIYTCGEFEDQPYIVMQWMSGGSLDLKLEESQEPFAVNDVVKWMRDIAEALDNARRHGIIHHDVKPANIMLDGDGNVKIGDFGISQALHDSRSDEISELTKCWASPHYVSPEKVATGKETYLGDIYSLGATFYHLLTGKEPFDDSLALEKLVRIRLENDPPDPRTRRPDIPEPVAQLVMAMMNRTAETRPSYRDIINDLNSILKGSGQKRAKKSKRLASGGGKLPSSTRTSVNLDHKELASAFNHAPRKGKGFPVIAVILILLLVLGVAGLFFFSQQSSDAGAEESIAADYAPAVTRAFAEGNCSRASSLAEQLLDDSSADSVARRQAAVQAAFASYLNGHRDAPSRCMMILDRVENASVSPDDDYHQVIRFLGGRMASTSHLRQRVRGGDIALDAAVEMAVLLRGFYDKMPLDQLQGTYRSYHLAVTRLPQGHWMRAWQRRVSRWIDWILSGSGDPDSLEPLIVAYRPASAHVPSERVPAGGGVEISRPATDPSLPALDLNSFTPEWLRANRAYAADRPKPGNYEFGAAQIQAYLATVPADRRAGETLRYQNVNGLKAYLCTMMMRSSYDGGAIKLRNGQRLRGSVMANHNYLSIRTSGGRRRVQWEDLPPEQIADFLEFYAKMRLDATAGTVSDRERQYEGAMDYVRIAVLHDWYGNYAKATEYVRKALATDSRVTRDVQKLILQ